MHFGKSEQCADAPRAQFIRAPFFVFHSVLYRCARNGAKSGEHLNNAESIGTGPPVMTNDVGATR